jgi:hypothetical protein
MPFFYYIFFQLRNLYRYYSPHRPWQSEAGTERGQRREAAVEMLRRKTPSDNYDWINQQLYPEDYPGKTTDNTDEKEE